MKTIQLIVNVVNKEEEEVEKLWNLNGQRHRENGPAIIETELMMFYRNGGLAEYPEPAAIYSDGEKVFYENRKYSHRVLPDGETIYRKSK